MTFFSMIEYGLVSFLHRQAIVRKRRLEFKRNNNDIEACQQVQILASDTEQPKQSIKITKKLKNLIYCERSFERLKKFNTNGNMSQVKKNHLKNFIKRLKQIRASKVDNVSKFLFPFVFLVFQFVYWVFYLRIFYDS